MSAEPSMTQTPPTSIEADYERGYQAGLATAIAQLQDLQQHYYAAAGMAPERHALIHAIERIKCTNSYETFPVGTGYSQAVD